MNATPDPPAIDSRTAFVQALHWGFHTAIAQDARRLLCVDANFAEWPWDDPALLQDLTAWLRLPQRRLVLLARSYDDLPRQRPRFNGWRAEFGHAIEAWQAPEDLARDLPTLLTCDGAVSVHLVDALHWRGRTSSDVRGARRWCEQIDVVLQRSERAFAVQTLGL